MFVWKRLLGTVPSLLGVIILTLFISHAFYNPKEREAVSYAIPYQEIISSALYSRAKPMFGSDPSQPYPAATWPVPIKHGQDLDKAKKLLAEASFPNGFKTTLSIDLSEATVREPSAILIQEALKTIGVEVSIEKVPGSNWFAQMASKTMPMVSAEFYSWLDYPDYFFFRTYDGANNSEFDTANYVNPELDKVIDVDAVAGWLGSCGGEDSPDDISRGLFAGEVGSPRLLNLFKRLGIRTTWFIPGHSIETFPGEMKAVADAGHEIGIHGYSHENPIAMTREQETEILDKCIELVSKLSGKRPTGYVAPWWEFSPVTNELLLERGIKYDHSLMHNDHQPYYVRVGDSWTKIDYAKKPRDWMVPLQRGKETDLIEIPASWYLDDLPPMMFIKKSPNSHGFVNPRDIVEMWRDQFDWVYREYDYAVFPMTIHPDVSGRPQGLLMLQKSIGHIIN